jgi:uncharacterized protein (TIGR03086 family)
MDAVELFRDTTETWLARARQVQPDHWKDPTPCSDWDVRALVNHIVGEQRWMPPLLAGSTIAEVGDRFDGDLLGEEPARAVEEAARDARESVPDAVAENRIAHLSFGDEPAADYVLGVGVDLLIHAWDLAAAIGADRRHDPRLVNAAAQWYASREEAYRSSGSVAARPAITDSDPQSVLLAAFGRDPAWSRGV